MLPHVTRQADYATDRLERAARRGVSRRAVLCGIGSLGASIAGLTLLGGCQLVSPPAATKAAVRRIGIIGGSPSGAIIQPDILGNPIDEIVNDLRQLGWVDGENLAIESRPAELAAELVRLPVELILAQTAGAAVAAMQQTSTIPIVFNYIDPFLVPGRVQSLAHPGGMSRAPAVASL